MCSSTVFLSKVGLTQPQHELTTTPSGFLLRDCPGQIGYGTLNDPITIHHAHGQSQVPSGSLLGNCQVADGSCVECWECWELRIHHQGRSLRLAVCLPCDIWVSIVMGLPPNGCLKMWTIPLRWMMTGGSPFLSAPVYRFSSNHPLPSAR